MVLSALKASETCTQGLLKQGWRCDAVGTWGISAAPWLQCCLGVVPSRGLRPGAGGLHWLMALDPLGDSGSSLHCLCAKDGGGAGGRGSGEGEVQRNG